MSICLIIIKINFRENLQIMKEENSELKKEKTYLQEELKISKQKKVPDLDKLNSQIQQLNLHLSTFKEQKNPTLKKESSKCRKLSDQKIKKSNNKIQ